MLAIFGRGKSIPKKNKKKEMVEAHNPFNSIVLEMRTDGTINCTVKFSCNCLKCVNRIVGAMERVKLRLLVESDMVSFEEKIAEDIKQKLKADSDSFKDSHAVS